MQERFQHLLLELLPRLLILEVLLLLFLRDEHELVLLGRETKSGLLVFQPLHDVSSP